MSTANSTEQVQLPHPDKFKHLAVCLSALDILLCERAPVFTYEKNWHTDVSTLLVDTRDGGQMSVRFSGKAAVIKGARADAFMHPGGTPPFAPETRLGFVTYPGLLDGFPAPLENLLRSNDSFNFLTFCKWHLHESGNWESGRIAYPDGVDDPDGSHELFEFFLDTRNVFARSSAELYGVTITDLEALDEVFKQKPLTDALLKRLNVRRPLSAYERRLQEIEYGVEPYLEPEKLKAKTVDATSASGASSASTSAAGTGKASHADQSKPSSGASKMSAREQELMRSTAFATPSAIGHAIGNFFREKTEFVKEHGAAGIAQDAIASALGAVTDVINGVPANSPIRKEPLFKWQVLTNAKLQLARKVGTAGMLETITAEFTAHYSDGRRHALVKFVDSLERDFRMMPSFLNESLSQLQGVYQRAGEEFRADADLFKTRAERAKSKETHDILILTDLPTVRIVCINTVDKDRVLNRIKRVLKDCGNNTYHLSAEPGEFEGTEAALLIILVSRDIDAIFKIIEEKLKSLELPAGSILVSPGGAKAPVQ